MPPGFRVKPKVVGLDRDDAFMGHFLAHRHQFWQQKIALGLATKNRPWHMVRKRLNSGGRRKKSIEKEKWFP